MQIVESKKCTGCGACSNICPHGAIKMTEDKYGFLKPVVNTKLCINCNLCKTVCPVINSKICLEERLQAYALIYKDDIIRLKSASGGAFYAFASKVIASGGAVYGVVWDENIKAFHSRAATLEELEQMHGSKYVQSNTKNTFKEVKVDLENGINVLYTGTPCQIAGLKGFLRKDYENLFTIDLICNGVQSRLLFEKYKQNFMLDKDDDEFITNINFRSKIEGWGKYCTEIKTNKHSYKIQNDLYPKVMDFSANYCCGECKFNKIPRAGDVTIGDFWGVENFNPNLNDKKGLSIILVNSTKGKKILKQIEDICVLTSVPLEVAINGNPNITGRIKSKGKQEVFLSKIQNPNISYIRLMKKYTKLPFYVIVYKILPNFIKSFIKKKILKKN